MKKLILVVVSTLILFSVSPALATDGQTALPTKFTYAEEWLNLNLFTWKAQSKITLIDRYANDRANEIQTIINQNSPDRLGDLISRYLKLEAKANQIIQKNKNNPSVLVDIMKNDVLSQQKTLSEARQNAAAKNDQKTIASAQEQAVNIIKQNIAAIQNTDTADKFANQVVGAWRDPVRTVKDEEATRVYAAGTTANSNTNDGIIIDQGEAKISQDTAGNLKIEYAPGTGPNSIVADSGKAVWKIQMSDGTTVDSYTVAGKVVVGGSIGVASNIVVKTTNGGTGTSAQTVVGNGTGTSGTANVKVVGGKPGVAAPTESSGSINSSGQYVAPATP